MPVYKGYINVRWFSLEVKLAMNARSWKFTNDSEDKERIFVAFECGAVSPTMINEICINAIRAGYKKIIMADNYLNKDINASNPLKVENWHIIHAITQSYEQAFNVTIDFRHINCHIPTCYSRNKEVVPKKYQWDYLGMDLDINAAGIISMQPLITHDMIYEVMEDVVARGYRFVTFDCLYVNELDEEVWCQIEDGLQIEALRVAYEEQFDISFHFVF